MNWGYLCTRPCVWVASAFIAPIQEAEVWKQLCEWFVCGEVRKCRPQCGGRQITRSSYTHTNRCMQTRWQSKSLTPAVPHLFYFKRGQTPNERISAALCSQMKHVWCKEHITHIADVHIPGCSNWAGSAMLQYTYNTHSPICQAGLALDWMAALNVCTDIRWK